MRRFSTSFLSLLFVLTASSALAGGPNVKTRRGMTSASLAVMAAGRHAGEPVGQGGLEPRSTGPHREGAPSRWPRSRRTLCGA